MLLLAPAVFLTFMLLGHWALPKVGIGVPKYMPVDLKALGNFTFDDDKGASQDIPQIWRDLDGRRVALNGFMSGITDTGKGTRTFRLVYNTGRPWGPPIQERVYAIATMPTNGFDSYDLVRAEGVLHVGVQRDQTGTSVFRMDVESVSDFEPDAPSVEVWIAFLISYLFLVFLVTVKYWPWHDIQTRRANAGLCQSCGYDLRASSGHCPECGAEVATRPVVPRIRRA